ncbi:type I-F CRISPR-associated endoribonuclease Cas6/Csy4 [Vibrio aphrogenes]|uniref:type I-F CRISPR-associated endoribonuclease Cas6/Csy4 n=1 Tax=Vibrio aphrogenes TaxID=1891186 RepID=UPI000B35B5C4|nr:type I-F CRISPR-associated endoribonuclease Cas6/Csy4 [Vibrio aphrogenes]
MKYYLDITLLPDTEINLGFLWFKVYQQIHLMLVENKIGEKDSAIGISFPQYGLNKGFPLGDKLRLLARSEQELTKVDVVRWLSRLEDYVHIKNIKPVPEKVEKFVYFKRWQHKSPEKLRLNVAKRAEYLSNKHGLDFEETKNNLLKSIENYEEKSALPYINLTSLSTDKMVAHEQRKNFKLFIEKQVVDKPSENSKQFTCYGLSRRSVEDGMTVPWFD